MVGKVEFSLRMDSGWREPAVLLWRANKAKLRRMPIAHKLVAPLALAAVLGLVAPLSGKAAAAEASPVLTETKERLSFADMERLASRPMEFARRGDLAGADQALTKVLQGRSEQYGEDSIEVADTLTSFLVLLYYEDRGAEAFAYAPRALDAVRRAWGSDHLEYALLLNDIVQMDLELNGDGVGPQSEAALQEAYRIRAEHLGVSHKETISTLIYLGEIRGLRSRTNGEVARAVSAIQILRRAIVATEENRALGNQDNVWARATLARVYARNGSLESALQTFSKAVELAAVQRNWDHLNVPRFAAALEEGGFKAEAAAILKQYAEATKPAG